MMAKTDTRPWAFDGNKPWEEFRAKAERAGLRFKSHNAWTSEGRLTVRGSDVHEYVVYYGERGVLVTSFIAISNNGEGFHLYLCDEHNRFEPTIDGLVEAGKAREARFADA
jgi:hypothetical protein